MSGPDPSSLLNELEHILDSDSLIDEIGFIHPSQFAAMNEEARSNIPSPKEATVELKVSEANGSDMVFWNVDHKLGISTSILQLLYNAAKHTFMEAFKQYKMVHKEDHEGDDESAPTNSSFSLNTLESALMKHSRSLLLLSCDYGTAWNCRKQIASKKKHSAMFMDELRLSSLVLSHFAKSECAWNHRRWVIKMIAGKCSNLQEIVERESELVKGLAEKSKMNYRAWYHLCWLVSYMTSEQVLKELSESRKWVGLHVADSSCFHYRARLMLWILEDARHCKDPNAIIDPDIHKLWKEELDWVEMLIKRYIGREALWLHRRFLALCWTNHFATGGTYMSGCSSQNSGLTCDVDRFISNELQLFESCTIIPDDEFEDYRTQATYAATYIVWLRTQAPEPLRLEFQKKLEAGRLKVLLNNGCPEKSVVWDSLIALCEKM